MEKVEVTTMGVDEAGIGTPANDGTRGSSLYLVPILLSADVPFEWGQLFESDWKQFPFRFRNAVSVSTNRIVFEKTTLEEVKQNKDAIKQAVAETNERYNEWREAEARREEAQSKKAEEERKQREEQAKSANEDW